MPDEPVPDEPVPDEPVPDEPAPDNVPPETPGTIAPGTIAPGTIAPGTIAPGTIPPSDIAPGNPGDEESVARYADMLAALGAEPRLRILRMLLRAHPNGLVVGEIMEGLGGSPSTLSHHLEKLKHERLVTVQRQGTFLRYRAATATLRDLLTFLYSECCGLNPVIDPGEILAGLDAAPVPAIPSGRAAEGPPRGCIGT